MWKKAGICLQNAASEQATTPATQYQILLRSQPHLHGQETGRQNLNSRSVKDDPERDPGSC